jgi:hypothetical protein
MLRAVDAIGRRGGNVGTGPSGGVDHDEATMAISARRKVETGFSRRSARKRRRLKLSAIQEKAPAPRVA